MESPTASIHLRLVRMAQPLVDGLRLWADIRTQNVSEPRPILLIDCDGVLIEELGYVGNA
jgi:hypothetical protein